MISDENNFQYVDKIILDDLISDYVCQTLPWEKIWALQFQPLQ